MQPTNVLIIDDSKLITKLVTKALLTNKIDNYYFQKEYINIAHDGMQAFEILGKNSNITLVISDVMMPVLTGEELIEILIDIDKINNLDIYFITTPNVANRMSFKSKEYSSGVLSKPFNDITFCEQMNQLQLEHKQKVEKQKRIKHIHNRQKRHLSLWIHEYFEKKKFTISQTLLTPLIESEFKHCSSIDDSELFMISQLILESYFNDFKKDHIIDISLLENIYDTWNKPDELEGFGIKQDIMNIINDAQSTLDDTSNTDDIIFAIIRPVNTIISQIKSKIKGNEKLDYNDFYIYFPILIEIFSHIDSNFQVKDANTLINQTDEIQKTYDYLKDLFTEPKISETFPFLQNNHDITKMLNHDIKTVMKNIHQKILPSYVHEINTIIWNKAKKSQKVVSFLKLHLKNKMPNTHNLLYHFNKIPKEDMKKFVKYDEVKISFISNDMNLLSLFKNSLIEHLPLWDVSVFTSTLILQRNIEKTKYKKLIIDLNFSDSVFNNGLQLLKNLQKKYPIIQELIENNAIYLLVSTKQVEQLHNREDRNNYSLIVKPINKNNLYEKIFWED